MTLVQIALLFLILLSFICWFDLPRAVLVGLLYSLRGLWFVNAGRPLGRVAELWKKEWLKIQEEEKSLLPFRNELPYLSPEENWTPGRNIERGKKNG